uniref:Uncharacterized protein n=1 Tax=Rhizochromulina marina TaxID=1034831 RepID=A0A7S2RF02_9STRA|mmetsp:Transcript_15333/g.45420  ORF Transcript_15333/g.45420 Transcript_15333/m.45420 type:complete len:133 (+) Transcript_15333:151-549(+)
MAGLLAKILSKLGSGSSVPESQCLDPEQKIFAVATALLVTRVVLSMGVQLTRLVFVASFAGFVAATLFLQSSCKNPESQEEMRTIRAAAGKRALVILGLHLAVGVRPPLIMSNVFTLLGILESGAFAEYAGA